MVKYVLGAETFAKADACDTTIFIQHELKNFLGRTLKIKNLTNSETLFNVIIRDPSEIERILMDYVKAAMDAYNDGIVEYVLWIGRNYYLAGTTTEKSILAQLIKVTESGKIVYEIEQCVKRHIDRPKSSPDNNPTNKKGENFEYEN